MIKYCSLFTTTALWLDCDLEGENIGFEVISICQEWIQYDNVYRAKFSALTRQELTTAYENLQRPDKYQALCVDARQELDLKIGVSRCCCCRLVGIILVSVATRNYFKKESVRPTVRSSSRPSVCPQRLELAIPRLAVRILAKFVFYSMFFLSLSGGFHASDDSNLLGQS